MTTNEEKIQSIVGGAKQDLTIPDLSKMHNADHVKASILLSRLPMHFESKDILIVSEYFSVDLFEAFVILLNEMNIYIVSPFKSEPSPRQNHATLGYHLSHTLNDALALRKKFASSSASAAKVSKEKSADKLTLREEGFDLIIFIAKNGTTVMRAARKVIDEHLRSNGVVLVSCPDDVANIPDSYHILQVSNYIRLLFDTEDTIVTLQR